MPEGVNRIKFAVKNVHGRQRQAADRHSVTAQENEERAQCGPEQGGVRIGLIAAGQGDRERSKQVHYTTRRRGCAGTQAAVAARSAAIQLAAQASRRCLLLGTAAQPLAGSGLPQSGSAQLRCLGDDGGCLPAGKLLQLGHLQRGADDALQHLLRVQLKLGGVVGVGLDVQPDGGARRPGAAAGRGGAGRRRGSALG